LTEEIRPFLKVLVGKGKRRTGEGKPQGERRNFKGKTLMKLY